MKRESFRGDMPLCSCKRDCSGMKLGPIYADNNAVGPKILNYVPEIGVIAPSCPSDMFEYIASNQDRGPVARALRDAIAATEGVSKESVLVFGSGLEMICKLPPILKRDTVVAIEGDFFGYRKAASLCELPFVEVPNGLADLQVSLEAVSRTLSGLVRPILYVTLPFLNPYQTKVPLGLVRELLEHHEDLIVVADCAYRRYSSPGWMAKSAEQHSRLIYLNVSAKDLGTCGARISWMVAGKELRDCISSRLLPYEIGMPAARKVTALLQSPRIVERIIMTQSAASELLREGLETLGFELRTGSGPWVLVHIGNHAGDIMKTLREEEGVFVQLQDAIVPSLRGWLRISATVPCEARAIVRALARHAPMKEQPPYDYTGESLGPPAPASDSCVVRHVSPCQEMALSSAQGPTGAPP